LTAREEHQRAAAVLERTVIAARRFGQPGVVRFCGAILSELAFRRGRFLEAMEWASHDVRFHEATASRDASFGHAGFARAAAVLGRLEDAEGIGTQALKRGARISMRGLEGWAAAGLGSARWGARRNDALPLLRRARLLFEGVTEPSLLWHHGDLAEALLEHGLADEARAVAADADTRARRCGTRYGRAVSARTAALIDRDEAQALWSAEQFDHLGAPFERARSELVVARLRRDHRLASDVAMTFDRLGSVQWAERARSAFGAAPAAMDRSPWMQLSTAELRVASAIARGASNREIAAELFISVKTVEWHLQSIFRKLEVRRRTELVVLLHRSGLPG
jgi:DNA-binding NarL/FixJ family response regulator